MVDPAQSANTGFDLIAGLQLMPASKHGAVSIETQDAEMRSKPRIKRSANAEIAKTDNLIFEIINGTITRT